MRRSQSPLRAISSPSAEPGVDGGRIGLRSAFLPHMTQEPEVSGFVLGHFVGSIDASPGARHFQPAGDPAGSSAAPHPISEEEI